MAPLTVAPLLLPPGVVGVACFLLLPGVVLAAWITKLAKFYGLVLKILLASLWWFYLTAYFSSSLLTSFP